MGNTRMIDNESTLGGVMRLGVLRAVCALALIAALPVAAQDGRLMRTEGPAEIHEVSIRRVGSGIEVRVQADAPITWAQYRGANGHLVVEVPNSRLAADVEDLRPVVGLISGVHAEQITGGSRPLARFEIATREPAEHTLDSLGSTLVLRFVAEGELAQLNAEADAADTAESPAVAPAPTPNRTPVPRPEPVPVPRSVGTPEAPAEGPRPTGVRASRLEGVEVLRRGSETVLRVLGDGEFSFSTFALENPPRFVIDLEGVVKTSSRSEVAVGSGAVRQVRMAQFQSEPSPVSRVVFDLDSSEAPVVTPESDGLSIRFGGAERAEVAPSVEREVPEADSRAAEASPQPRLDLPAVDPQPPVTLAELDVVEDEEAPPLPELPSVLGEVPVSGLMPESFEAEPAPEPAPAPALAAAPQQPQIAPQEPPLPEPSPEPVAEPLPTPVPAPDTPSSVMVGVAESAPELPEDASADDGAPVVPFGARDVTGQKTYVGDPISLSLKDADVTEVLRTIAKVSGLNMVIQPGVEGGVTVELESVPWDQALEQILKIHRLGMELDGNILRIAPVQLLSQEAQEQGQLRAARSQSVPLSTIMRKISYAQATEIAAILNSSRGGGGVLSQRGSVSVDVRTNTLILKELPGNLEQVMAIIDNLDTPEEQVMIEARIVETSKSFSRSLGVEWGLNGVADSVHGNTTGLQFPNNVDIEGGANLFTGGANGFLNATFGNVLNTFQLDMALIAAESEGLVNVISAPKVATLNNERASIQSGLQIPIQTVANNTVTVQFVNATLRLDVTPHVTADGTILMEIRIQKREPQLAFAVVGATNAPIATREVRNRVLVRDGGTAVIGGIYEVSTDISEDRVPGLSNLPLFGRLFRNKNRLNQNEELLIFITPRVIQL